MKTLILLLLSAGLLSGCASLFPGFNTDEAQAVAEKRQAELQAVFDRVEQLDQAVSEARDAYEKAKRDGDEKALFEAGQVLVARIGDLKLGKQDLDNAKNAFAGALQDFQDAKSSGQYLNVIFGSLAGILSVFGIGVPMIKRRDNALATTASNAANVFGGTEDFDKFLAAQRESLSAAEKKVLNKQRGK